MTTDELRAGAQFEYRLLNVFAIPGGGSFTGNPLCVFVRAEGLQTWEMQALAQQFNLTETTFVLPANSASADARVRIFKPTFEMPFAGHPVLGSAQVVAGAPRDRVVLELSAGLVRVTRGGSAGSVGPASPDAWHLRAPHNPAVRTTAASRAEIALALGLSVDDIAEQTLFIDTGVDQLIIPLTSVAAVQRARPNAELFAKLARSSARDESVGYLWSTAAGGELRARCFFVAHAGLLEDPATGSACANLGGWLLATGRSRPLQLTIQQGAEMGRPSRLYLAIDDQDNIFVGGHVVTLGAGSVSLTARELEPSGPP